MRHREQRTFTSEVRELRRISAWWREWAAACGRPGEDGTRRGELCLNEAVGNIIQHGSADHQIAIEIAFESGADSVQVTISDDGPPFNPLEYPAPALPAAGSRVRGGGLGIHLMRTHAAEIGYRRADGHNILRLTFNDD